VVRRLERRWYDEADLVTRATTLVESGHTDVTGGRPVVVYLPERLDDRSAAFVRALGAHHRVTVVIARTGDAEGDAGASRIVARLDPTMALDPPTGPVDASPRLVISTTDADDEVRHAVRAVLDAARGDLTGAPVAFERIAVLWPSHRPYARIVEHQLNAAGLPWNGRSGTEVTERIAPRLLLDLLEVDRRGVRRDALFDLLADIPLRRDGRRRSIAEWERVSRAAGISTSDDWSVRLDALATHDRWSEPAVQLRDFVVDLVRSLGDPSAVRTWWDWSTWCVEQLDGWFGDAVVRSWPDAEYRAWEQLGRSIERLRHLDGVGPPVTRHDFRAVLETALSDEGGREGRVGSGVTVGSLAGANGLDVDVAVVVGAVEGLLPPPPSRRSLFDDAAREGLGLPSSTDVRQHLRHHLLVTMATTHTIVTASRGDLRASTAQHPSRWITAPPDLDRVASHFGAMGALANPATPTEHRLAARLRHVQDGGPVGTAPGVSSDRTMRRAIAARRARASSRWTAFDGDLTGVTLPPIDAHPIAPTSLEAWVECPFAYFAGRVLGVRPVDDVDSLVRIDAAERGSLLHMALDAFHRAVIAGQLAQPDRLGWTDEHRDALLGFFDDACAHTRERGRTGPPASWASDVVRLRTELLAWLDHDSVLARSRQASVIASEWRFGDTVGASFPLGDGRRLLVRGSIDRVDERADGGLVVTDHKTGRPDAFKRITTDDPTLGGTRFQLALYAHVARSIVGRPDAPVIGEYSTFQRGDYERFGFELTTANVARVGEAVDHVVAGIEAGWFPARPDAPGFRLFTSCRYCDPDDLGTDSRFAEWERKRHDPRAVAWFGDDPGDAA
jgi:hypothetical protein